ncbi:MAG: RidA family protein [Actinomycetota bacterium]
MPPAVGFSHVAIPDEGRLIFLAGQAGHHEDGSLDDTLIDQFGQACRNVERALTAVGASPTDTVSLQIFVTDLAGYRANLTALGHGYRQVFGRHYPPMALVGVSGLFDPLALVELVAVATMAEKASATGPTSP